MDCNHARELMNSYIDGVLHEAESVALEEHISCCENCHEEYDMLKKISADLIRTAAPLPKGFAERVHCALVEEKIKSENKRKFVFPYYRVASGLVAALVIAVVGKYGIYDTYKKVNKDTTNMAVQVEKGNTVAEQIAPVSEKEAEPAEKEKTISVSSVAEPVVPEPVTSEPAEEPVVKTYNTADIPAVAPELPQPQIVAEPLEIAIEIQPRLKSVIIDEPMGISLDEAGEESAFSGGSAVVGEVTPEAPVEEIPPITEPIPAVVTLYLNNEGNMLMMNNFLLTFLEGSAVQKTDEGITVTVSADNYESVISHISENSYVKSVEKGIPLDGVGIIIIK